MSVTGGGGSAPKGRGSATRRRCLLPGVVSQHAMGQIPPVYRILDACYLLKILPCPNFVPGGNNKRPNNGDGLNFVTCKQTFKLCLHWIVNDI